TLSYQLRGERALASERYKEAVSNFGKAIELDPGNPLHYLERGMAHFKLGEYDQSLSDYQKYTAQAEKHYPMSVADFSVGFAKELPKGVYESGKHSLLFLVDFVKHPIHTSEQLVSSFGALANLVRED